MKTQTSGGNQPQSMEDKSMLIQRANEQNAQRLMDIGKEISSESKECFKKKVAEVKKFKQEVYNDVQNVIKHVIKIKDKLRQKANGKDHESSEGILTHQLQEYNDCFTIDQDKLDSMLSEDQIWWQEQLKKVGQKEKQMQENFNKMLEDQRKFITDFMSASVLVKKRMREIKLTKLPKLTDGNYGINFEWPTESDLKSMKFDQPLKLKKIEVWQDRSCLSGIRVTLQNGSQSPIFQTQCGDQNNHTVMECNGDIRKVAAYHTWVIFTIELEDANDKSVCKWGDEADSFTHKEQQIPKDQHLIGIYGNHTYSSYYITSFGFIVAEDK